ncbi:hypothetical protein MMC22_004818 [Lobaria immixta]|nr:hypothetical protein [Lobaria immixta]
MFHAYGLCRFHPARCLHKQCSTLGQRNSHSTPLTSPRTPPYIRSVLFEDYKPTRVQLKGETLIQTITHVKTLQDLFDILPRMLFRVTTWGYGAWGEKKRGRFLMTLEDVIAETKPMRAKTLNPFRNAYELPGFTRIFRHFGHNGLPIPRILIFHGLKAAACGNSPAAMRHYLLLLRPQSRTPGYILDAKQWDMIVKCILVTTRSPPNRSEKTLRQKKAWAEVITHREEGILTVMESRGKNRKRRAAFSMFEILIEFGVDGISNYFRLLSRFCESQDIFEEGMSYLVLGTSDKIPPTNLPSTITNFIFNSYLQTLLAKKSPKRAWKLAQEARSEFGTIQDKTWRLLLRHPEFLAEWKPGMEPPVMNALERYMSEAERHLGVKWTGGAHGFHMPRGEEHGPH